MSTRKVFIANMLVLAAFVLYGYYTRVNPVVKSLVENERADGTISQSQTDKKGITPSTNPLDLGDSICSRFRSEPGLSSPTTFWMASLNAGRIQDALLSAPDNLDGSKTAHLQDLSARVIAALPPSRLRRSVNHFASSLNDGSNHWAKVSAILEKLRLRHRRVAVDISSNSSSSTTLNEKVKILVFGGSPTAGSNCYRNGALKKEKAGPCAWPGHLEGFLNAYVGFDAFEVVNYAIGASDSSLATAIMQHGLLPESMKGPEHEVDIVIYAYGVNDFERFSSGGTDMKLTIHNFMSAVNNLAPCQGPRPITLLLDDLVVNYNKGHDMLQVEEYHSEISKVAQWHELPLISYSNAVKGLWLNNTDEELLVDWLKDSKHAPRGGHIAITLTLAFNFLNLVQEYCDDDPITDPQDGRVNSTNALDNANMSTLMMDPSYLPPLHTRPSLQTVTESWQKNIMEAEDKKMNKCRNGGQERCVFG